MTTPRERLKERLGGLTRLEYLAVYAALELGRRDTEDVAEALPSRIRELSQSAKNPSGRRFEQEDIRIRPDQVAELARRLPAFVVDLLLVDLEAFVHGFLADLAGRTVSEDTASIEVLVAHLWPKGARIVAQAKKTGRPAVREGPEHWSYREVVLLSEVRHSIVHGNGEVDLGRSRQRLLDAGWTNDELDGEASLRTRTINDFLRFKRAVRTLANEALKPIPTGTAPLLPNCATPRKKARARFRGR